MNRARSWLAASLLLNLFLVGMLVGGALLVRARSPMIFAGAMRIAGSELPADERHAFRAAMREARRSRQAELVAARRERLSAADLLRAPAVDQIAVIGALARAREADAAVRAAVEDRAVRFAATLPRADRARLADAIADRAQKGRP